VIKAFHLDCELAGRRQGLTTYQLQPKFISPASRATTITVYHLAAAPAPLGDAVLLQHAPLWQFQISNKVMTTHKQDMISNDPTIHHPRACRGSPRERHLCQSRLRPRLACCNTSSCLRLRVLYVPYLLTYHSRLSMSVIIYCSRHSLLPATFYLNSYAGSPVVLVILLVFTSYSEAVKVSTFESITIRLLRYIATAWDSTYGCHSASRLHIMGSMVHYDKACFEWPLLGPPLVVLFLSCYSLLLAECKSDLHY